MRRHWQKRPLLVRGAIPGFTPLLDRSALLDLAGQEGVESRLVVQRAQAWTLRHGPFARRQLPPFKQPLWTLLVKGVDMHNDAAHQLLQQFRFVPDARLDDLMVSYATDGGGVGPHFDSYDVFLLQAYGRRRWRIGRQRDMRLASGVPLKILSNFVPEEEFVLEPGDMLYLPPRYAHDGLALGECMTYSIGFRAPTEHELARELLQRIAEQLADPARAKLYQDARQPAAAASAEIPATLTEFAQAALWAALADPTVVQRALGEYLTEPKAQVWFEGGSALAAGALRLDRRTRMLYDEAHVFINGESFFCAGRDAPLVRKLALERCLQAADVARLSAGARSAIAQWCDAGWLHATE
jgi:50S ribosomal protein L16 3-hydroxylase